MFGRKVRVRYLVGIAGVDETVDPGQVADLPPAEAEAHIGAGRAELAPDAPLGRAPSLNPEGKLCWRCGGGPQPLHLGTCDFCAARI
jgi:hypothetical protein